MREIKVGTDVTKNNFIGDGGELLDTEMDVKNQKIVIDDKEQFTFMYASIIGVMKDLNGGDIKLLSYCSMRSETNSNRIALVKPIIQEIADTFEISVSSVKNSIVVLKNKDILIPLGSGVYRINPKYYWRGTLNQRLKTMKYILEIECPDCL